MEKEQFVNSFLPQLKSFLQNETVFGKPYVVGETTIIPVNTVKVGFGFGEGSDKRRVAAGGGVTMTPVGFLIVQNDSFKYQMIGNSSNSLDTLLEKVPEFLEKTYELASKIRQDIKKDQETT